MVLKREISLSGSLQQRRLTEPNAEATLVLMWNFEPFFLGWVIWGERLKRACCSLPRTSAPTLGAEALVWLAVAASLVTS